MANVKRTGPVTPEQIRTLLEDAQITQDIAAKLVGKAPRTMRNYLSGKIVMTTADYNELKRQLGI